MLYEFCESCIAEPFCKKKHTTLENSFELDWCAERGRLLKALELSNLPREYHQANIFNYKVDDSNNDIFNSIKKVVDDVATIVDNQMSLLITGQNCGTGKTFNAAVVLNHYIYKKCLLDFDYENPIALYVDYTTFINDLRDFDNGNLEARRLLDVMKTVPLLMIDDLGAGILSRFTREQTYIILNARYNNNLSTIVTSNLSLGQLNSEEYLGSRNMSRLTTNSLWLELSGKDRRRTALFRGK